MNLLVNTREEYDTLCRILDRKNIKYRVKDFELNIEVDEDLAERVHVRKEDISIDEYNNRVLKEVKRLQIGAYFIFGSYKGAPIKWLKVSKYRAISVYILDNMAFGGNNNYDTSKVRAWCNDLGAEYGLRYDDIYIPSEKEIICWFHTEKLRKCDYSDEAKKRGIDDGVPVYWLKNAIRGDLIHVRTVYSSGMFGAHRPYLSHLGVRPVLKI